MKTYRMLMVLPAAVLWLGWIAPSGAAWAPVGGQIMTRWAKDVTPDKALPEYPRPQMVRKDWKSLNGLWEYAIAPKESERPAGFQGQILVPFPVQSALSGVKKTVSPQEILWYRRTFTVPSVWQNGRVLLHFGAVDWQATVWINGTKLGSHQGGYDPFSFDITDALKKSGEQEIVLSVWDPNDAGAIPRGKQVLNPRGIMYTAVTGVWRTAWIESVPKASIESLKITPNVDRSLVSLIVAGRGMESADAVAVEVTAGGKTVGKVQGRLGEAIDVKIDNPKLWASGNPFLYDLKVTLTRNGKAIDGVTSYFGMRKIEVKKDAAGVNRLFLNGKAVFQFGPLDQGWWPDGLYTAPTDEALKYDIEETLRMGFNMARKHVKVEPDRWYYWADKLGLLVWQDMPSGDRPWKGEEPVTPRRSSNRPFDKLLASETYDVYEREYKAMIENYYNHPCIVMWVPFNEGWGQFDTPRIVEWTRKLDPTRPVNNASGWTDMNAGDVSDMHNYPGPGMNKLEEKRASVLGEYGGLGLAVEGHLWVIDRRWGYRDMVDAADLTRRYISLTNALKAYVARGLAAAVYTQTTDCEGEVNGLLTYDRAVNKIGTEAIAKIHLPVYEVKPDPNAPIPKVEMPPAPPTK